MTYEELKTLAAHSKAVVDMVNATAFCGKTRALTNDVTDMALETFLTIYPDSPLARLK